MLGLMTGASEFLNSDDDIEFELTPLSLGKKVIIANDTIEFNDGDEEEEEDDTPGTTATNGPWWVDDAGNEVFRSGTLVQPPTGGGIGGTGGGGQPPTGDGPNIPDEEDPTLPCIPRLGENDVPIIMAPDFSNEDLRGGEFTPSEVFNAAQNIINALVNAIEGAASEIFDIEGMGNVTLSDLLSGDWNFISINMNNSIFETYSTTAFVQDFGTHLEISIDFEHIYNTAYQQNDGGLGWANWSIANTILHEILHGVIDDPADPDISEEDVVQSLSVEIMIKLELLGLFDRETANDEEKCGGRHD